jgi:hypothetical protein
LPLTLSAQLADGNKAIAVTMVAKILAEFMIFAPKVIVVNLLM